MSLYAVVMAGGSGERFWPVSTPDRPKQFLDLAGDGAPLLRQAYERACSIAGPERACLSTLPRLAASSLEIVPEFAQGGVFAEPDKRNTAGALAWTAAQLMSRHPSDWRDVVMAVLTADQRIKPRSGFLATAEKAVALASRHGLLVTIGIRPTRPDTGFGYIEQGVPIDSGHLVVRFREKPNERTAEEFLASGKFLWNSGMFFWTLGAFADELSAARPDAGEALMKMAAALEAGDQTGAEEAFRSLPSLSIDYALMEASRRVGVVEAEFEWDDLGAWDSLPRSLGMDDDGNTVTGPVRLVDSSGCIISTDGPQICLLGVEDMVVVAHQGKVMVIPKSRAQDVKKLAQAAGS